MKKIVLYAALAYIILAMMPSQFIVALCLLGLGFCAGFMAYRRMQIRFWQWQGMVPPQRMRRRRW